jgi:hypothetical protein
VLEVTGTKLRNLLQAITVEDLDPALLGRDQTLCAKLPQDAIDVHRGQTERVAQILLGRREFELAVGSEIDESEPGLELQQQMGCALESAAPPDVDQVLDHDRLLERERPEHRGAKSWILPDQIEHSLVRELRDGGFRDRDDGMIRLRQQKAAQTKEIAGHGKVDDLPPAVRQQLRAGRPTPQ